MYITMQPATTSGRIPVVEVVVVEGLDSAAVPRLAQLLDEALAMSPDRLILDLSGCPTIDAAAIGLLLKVHRRACQAGGQLTLRSPSARLRRNLQLSRADRVLDITPAAGS
jgi:anti-anti-sigma factor